MLCIGPSRAFDGLDPVALPSLPDGCVPRPELWMEGKGIGELKALSSAPGTPDCEGSCGCTRACRLGQRYAIRYSE